MSTFARGDIVASKYRIVGLVGSGGMGSVYEVEHLQTGRRRALKVLLPHLLLSPSHERFKREATVASRVETDLIVDVLDSGVDEVTQLPFLLMELLRGEDLNKRLRRLGPLPPEEVVSFLRQTAMALDKTHRANIVHRDLKPGNLFLAEREDGEPRIKVLDFGIAKILAEDEAATAATRGVGTPIYMAPEQFKSKHKVSPACDIYALGMVSFTLLTGWPYWHDEATSDENVFAFADAVRNGPVEPATARALRRRTVIPPGYDVWFARVCARDPKARFSSASLAMAALGDVFGLSSIPMPRPSQPSEPGSIGEPPPLQEAAPAPFAFQSAGGMKTNPSEPESASIDRANRTFGDVVVSTHSAPPGRAAFLPALLVAVALIAIATFLFFRRPAGPPGSLRSAAGQTATSTSAPPPPTTALPASTLSAPSTTTTETTPEPVWTAIVELPEDPPTPTTSGKPSSGASAPQKPVRPWRGGDPIYSRD